MRGSWCGSVSWTLVPLVSHLRLCAAFFGEGYCTKKGKSDKLLHTNTKKTIQSFSHTLHIMCVCMCVRCVHVL